jgi:hypothetical protein
MGAAKTSKCTPISSKLFPIFEVQGHGSHWRPILREGYISGSEQKECQAVLTTYVVPEQPYKDWARNYIEVVEKLYRMPGASDVCDDLLLKVATKTEEIINLGR